MNALEKITGFIKSYPGADVFQAVHVDYTDQIPANLGTFPSGLVEVRRNTDLCGNATVTNQYNFMLEFVFEKAPGDDAGAAVNADWLMDFQEWVQAQSILGKAPAFGDVPRTEKITAQNGVLYSAEDEGLATYMVQVTVQFTQKFPTTNPWFM